MLISDITLTLFFSRSMSLKGWYDTGMIDREVVLYNKLKDKGISINFVTYGNSSEFEYQNRIPGIKILCNRWSLPNRVYEKILYLIHAKTLKTSNLIKTNQMNGADVAFRYAYRHRKPLIGRMGYLWSDFVARENGSSDDMVLKARITEDKLFKSSNRIVVTTAEMADSIQDRIPDEREKPVVIPNYVETDRFSPDADQPKEFDVIFVGRLCDQKNVSGLLKAIKDLHVKALIVGDGDLKGALQNEFRNLNVNVRWENKVPNCDLPIFMNRSRLFVLPSFYEGHPKTLIEAMSCGLPVIGADSPGISGIIDHGVNGLLCNTDAESIRLSIQMLLEDIGLSERLGKNARKYILNYFSLERVIEMEYQLYHEVLKEHVSQV